LLLEDTVIVNRTVVVREQGIAVNPGIEPEFVAHEIGKPIPAYEVRPRILAGTTAIKDAVEVRPGERPEQLKQKKEAVRATSNLIEPAKNVEPPKALSADEKGRLGQHPPRAAAAAAPGGQPNEKVEQGKPGKAAEEAKPEPGKKAEEHGKPEHGKAVEEARPKPGIGVYFLMMSFLGQLAARHPRPTRAPGLRDRIATRYQLRNTNGDPAEPYGGLQNGDLAELMKKGPSPQRRSERRLGERC
jgi:hypothetical protein